jgi:hypothetical protein
MKRKLDLQKVEAALKRAAKDGVSGSRDARSGRMNPSEAEHDATADVKSRGAGALENSER